MVPDGPQFQMGEEFTLEAWVRPSGAGEFSPIFYKQGEGGTYGYALWAGEVEDGVPAGEVNDGTYPVPQIEGKAELPPDVWNHVALTFDGARMRLYVDGALVATGASSAPLSSEGPLKIGCAEDFGYEHHFDGRIDEARVYERALSGAEVDADMEAPIQTSQDEQRVQSGIAGTEIEIDGDTVERTTEGCTKPNCDIQTEWTLESSECSAGMHTVVIKVTDGVGNTTTKTLEVRIGRDTTSPHIFANSSLYSAPSGWVEQHSYPVSASASDPHGYGGLPARESNAPGEFVNCRRRTDRLERVNPVVFRTDHAVCFIAYIGSDPRHFPGDPRRGSCFRNYRREFGDAIRTFD